MPELLVDSRRAAIVHDFFTADGGAERCAIELAALLPEAPIYTSFFDRQRFGDRIDPARVHTWPLQRWTGGMRHFRSLFPLYAAYFGSLRIPDARLVVSSSIAFAKAVRTAPGAVHVSYIHTPMRYAWDLDTYLSGSSYSLPARLGAHGLRPIMQAWDRRTARRPDVLVANSATVQGRIRRHWRRDVDAVIHPPVAVDEIPLGDRDDGFMLIAARLLAYRRVDLAIEACRSLGRELIIVGEGPERARLEARAGPTVHFLGHVTRERVIDLLRRCHAYLVPGIEDFGIAPVEAMAAGKPVIAFRGGGALETLLDGVTGLYFDDPDARSLARSIQDADSMRFDAVAIRRHAQTYSREAFLERWRELLGGVEGRIGRARR